MILGAHNTWSYLKPKHWWMRPFAFIARCQEVPLKEQYKTYGVRCFDLRVKFDKNGELVVAHGMMAYAINKEGLMKDLKYLNGKKDVYVRVLHEVRTQKEYTEQKIQWFVDFCEDVERKFKNIKFWCGRSLVNYANPDYIFQNDPSCEEKYSSVCPPRLIDDWYPKWFAKKNNKQIKEEGTDKDILLIDFVNLPEKEETQRKKNKK